VSKGKPLNLSAFKKHSEKTGTEGNAREQILRGVLRHGWIRLRRHANRYWSIQTGRVTDEKKSFIRRWARKILSGEAGYTENDSYMAVKIMGLEDGFGQEFTVGELARIR
jgi:hypothetical protein